MGLTAIEVKYKHIGNFRGRDVANAVEQIKGEGVKLVIVTNAPLSEEVRMINGAGDYNGVPVEVVTWNDEGHDGLLQRAIARGTS